MVVSSWETKPKTFVIIHEKKGYELSKMPVHAEEELSEQSFFIAFLRVILSFNLGA